jgi:hypothetical protein
MKNTTKIKLAWKYRRPLWKYRSLIRHRKEIAGVALAAAAIIAGNCAYRYVARTRAARLSTGQAD